MHAHIDRHVLGYHGASHDFQWVHLSVAILPIQSDPSLGNGLVHTSHSIKLTTRDLACPFGLLEVVVHLNLAGTTGSSKCSRIRPECDDYSRQCHELQLCYVGQAGPLCVATCSRFRTWSLVIMPLGMVES